MELPLFDTDLKFFEVNERVYVLDIPTSTLFEIHPNMRRILEMSVHNEDVSYLEELKREFHFIDWTEMSGDLREMIDNRHLTIYASRVSPYELKEQKVNNFILNICHDCNMVCRYCYQTSNPYYAEKEHMKNEVATKAIEYLFKESPDNHVFITISGGEPLMNPDMVRFIVRTAEENADKYDKKVCIKLMTNGTLIDQEMLNFLSAAHVELIISLDGTFEEANSLRTMADGQSSLLQVMEKLELVKASNINYKIKSLFHHTNLPLLSDILKGYFNESYLTVGLKPVLGNKDPEYALTEADIAEITVRMRQLFQHYRKNEPEVLRLTTLTSAVQSIATQKNVGYACGAGKNTLTVTPNGDIYPCQLLIGVEEFKMGNILDGTIEQEQRKNFYQPLHVLNRENCRSCWARYFCGGGCVGENFITNGSLTQTTEQRCRMIRSVMEQAVEIYCALLTEEDKLNFNPERRKSGREIYKIS